MYLLALRRLLKNLIFNSVFRASEICLSELRETRDGTRWMDKSEVLWNRNLDFTHWVECCCSWLLLRHCSFSRQPICNSIHFFTIYVVPWWLRDHRWPPTPFPHPVLYHKFIHRNKNAFLRRSSNSLVIPTDASTVSLTHRSGASLIVTSTTEVFTRVCALATTLCLLFLVITLSPIRLDRPRRNRYLHIWDSIGDSFKPNFKMPRLIPLRMMTTI